MAFQLAPRTSSVCSQSPYSKFLPLQGFAPAVSFCKAFEVNSKAPSISGCPNGNSLCAVLSSLSSCEVAVVIQACICIGVAPSTTVSVPKSTASSTSPGKATSQSTPVKSSPTTTNPGTSVKSTPSTWGTPPTATNTCSASTVTVTVTPSICLPAATTTTSAPQCTGTPTCVDGAQAVCPPPDGAICQQNGTLSPTNWDLITGGTATSVSACAAQCLSDPNGCSVSEYDYTTGNCQLFNGGNAQQLGFVPVAASVFIDSDVACFMAC